MTDENKRNIQYFEAQSMRELFKLMQIWQGENNQRFLSLVVEKELEVFCCIALVNPTEVIIRDGAQSFGAGVDLSRTALKVRIMEQRSEIGAGARRLATWVRKSWRSNQPASPFISLFELCGADDHLFVTASLPRSAANSGKEGVFSGDPSAGSEATEDGVEDPLPRSEHGGRLVEEGKL